MWINEAVINKNVVGENTPRRRGERNRVSWRRNDGRTQSAITFEVIARNFL